MAKRTRQKVVVESLASAAPKRGNQVYAKTFSCLFTSQQCQLRMSGKGWKDSIVESMWELSNSKCMHARNYFLHAIDSPVRSLMRRMATRLDGSANTAVPTRQCRHEA